MSAGRPKADGRPLGAIAWHALVLAAALVAASEQVWLLSRGFERVSPVPILLGLALVSASLSDFGPVERPDSGVGDRPLRVRSQIQFQIGAVLTVLGVGMTARSGLTLLIAAALALSYLGAATTTR